MVNSVSDVKLGVDPNLCTLQDIEICEKGADEVSTVDENGQPNWHKETWLGDAEFAYYFCCECGTDWTKTAVQDQAKCWELAKAHLSDVSS